MQTNPYHVQTAGNLGPCVKFFGRLYMHFICARFCSNLDVIYVYVKCKILSELIVHGIVTSNLDKI